MYPCLLFPWQFVGIEYIVSSQLTKPINTL
jgi:hypothetical protein